MNEQLDAEDRRAVDLFLDGKRQNGQEPQVRYQPGPVDPARIQAVEKLLSLLNHLPAPEPPPNLTARTMQRIDAEMRMVEPEAARQARRPTV